MPDTSTFADTAAYFEARTEKAKNAARRIELAAAARFYRAVSEIIPTFPSGYKPPPPHVTKMRLEKRAEICKALAAVTRDAECRAKLLRLAASYEQAAAGPAMQAVGE